MSTAKRQRVAVEHAAGNAPVCYLPSVLSDAGDASPEAEQTAVKRCKYTLHSRRTQHSSVELVHAALGGQIEYVGRSDADENAGVQPCSYALAVYRPGAAKLQLLGVAGDRLFRLDSRLPGLVYAPTGAGAEDDEGSREVRKLAAKRLVDEFGSTRRRRQLTAREAGVVAADRISGGEAVKELLGEVAAKGQGEGLTKEEVQRRAFSHRTIPPHDPSATHPSAAYPLELLLGPGPEAGAGAGAAAAAEALLKDLNVGTMFKLAEDEEAAQEAAQKESVHPYVLSRLPLLRQLQRSTDPAARPRARTRARYLALLGTLLRLQAKPVLVVKEEGLASALKELRVRSEPLAEHLLAKFYVRTSDPLRGVRYERPDALKALLLGYVLAAALVLEEGFMDREQFEELRRGLKMDAPKLAQALQQLGAVCKATKLKVERDGHVLELPCYTASLLRQTDPTRPAKTLADCFPEIRLAKGPKGGR
ncbi:hypothetical protein HYH03_018777 [Edaphochlamys debaryana]|uniref:Uncharacterized protein n=1 Tax=Edaphochlamys debaryana TaxID=47281 RepID=A0A836BMZ9_9CHLO|nr:hypothetical protein HYH03_018777 [Edaphochlamys debaryana]|eukprot:KAG2482292.1 hypothetical protein HYH03_018777 [Edaphochlamys debaryana]